jgi:hypothetical protein
MEEKKLTDEKSMFNYIANDVLGQVKPLYLRKRIVREVFDLIHSLQEENAEQKAEIERLTEYRNQLALCNKGLQDGINEYQVDNAEFGRKNAELQKQVDGLLNRKIEPQIIHCHGILKGCDRVQQAEKDMAKEVLQGLEERKERVKAFYGIAESVGVDVAIRAVKEIVKQKGVEVE